MAKITLLNQFALYIHLPWCVKRCPYCDFNAHKKPDIMPEQEYIEALKADIQQAKSLVLNKKLTSIFFGGGTPSLFQPENIDKILQTVNQTFGIDPSCEITLEANPGTLTNDKLYKFNQYGINRLSLGVQSFDNNILKALGRIHDKETAIKALDIAMQLDFRSVNCDIMFGVPGQNQDKMLFDLKTAIKSNCQHISWYELTIEPNTLFAKYPPKRVCGDTRAKWAVIGKRFLQENSFNHYEVSAFAKENHQCQHNSNVWLFGDYLGIGAGAHSKITSNNTITRYVKPKHPKQYIKTPTKYIEEKKILQNELVFEYLLNRLRLFQPVQWSKAYDIANLSKNHPKIKEAIKLNYIKADEHEFSLTLKGRDFLDDVISLFL